MCVSDTFIPFKSLNESVKDERYYFIYKTTAGLSECIEPKLDMLYFMNSLEWLLHMIRNNQDKPLDIKEYVGKIEISNFWKTDLLAYVAELLMDEIEELHKKGNDTRKLSICKQSLLDELDEIKEEVYSQETIKKFEQDRFSRIKYHLHDILQAQDKLKYLVKAEIAFLQEYDTLDQVPLSDQSFIKKCELERQKIEKLIELENKATTLKQPISCNEAAPIQGYPVFAHVCREAVFEGLKLHFKEEQHESLKTLIETGEALASPILFCSDGKRLAFAFRELYDKGFITMCNKSQLQNWIRQNFTYLSRNKPDVANNFKLEYLEKIISSQNYYCKTPLPILKNLE